MLELAHYRRWDFQAKWETYLQLAAETHLFKETNLGKVVAQALEVQVTQSAELDFKVTMAVLLYQALAELVVVVQEQQALVVAVAVLLAGLGRQIQS